MNLCVMIGNLVDDPELTTLPNGIAKCSFRIGVSREFKNADGSRTSDFFTVIAWRTMAELCAKYLQKGCKCAVRGSVQNRSYDAKDGTKRYVTEIVAERVQFFFDKAKEEQSGFTEIEDSELPF